MKRLFYSAGLFVTLSFFGSCAQHDENSPDTSGAAPYGSGGPNTVGIDTTHAGVNQEALPNAGNDFSNNNQQINTADSNLNRR